MELKQKVKVKVFGSCITKVYLIWRGWAVRAWRSGPGELISRHGLSLEPMLQKEILQIQLQHHFQTVYFEKRLPREMLPRYKNTSEELSQFLHGFKVTAVYRDTVWITVSTTAWDGFREFLLIIVFPVVCSSLQLWTRIIALFVLVASDGSARRVANANFWIQR